MLNGTRYTTINTDAGVKNGISAIAYWIRSENSWLTGSKKLKDVNLDSTEAELKGIVNAMYLLTLPSNEFFANADRIVINCDNQGAIHKLKRNDVYKDVIPILTKIYTIIPRSKFKFKWVKGHSKRKGSKYWVNNWCDKELKKHY